MNRPNSCLLAVSGLAALALAGCGSSSSTSSTAASTASAPVSETAPASTTSTAAAPSTQPGTVLATKHSGDLGQILDAGSKRLTVYLFEADKNGESACSGACAKVWPPVTTEGDPTVKDGALAGKLGTITRSDNTKQLTYDGHPLYYYIKDKDDGDTYGQGSDSFGAEWYVLDTKGGKVDNDDDSDSGDHS
jgi:predicted lipoprotein with Yx(FWY)xxD motif